MSRAAAVLLALAAASALAAGGLAACGHSPATTLHDLTPVPAAGSAASYAGPPVRVEAVRLPPALDRLELLRETAPGAYTVEENDRWAAPPSRLALQALTADLALRLPPGAVTPPASDSGPVSAVAVEVLTFSAGPGTATLTADWAHGCRPGPGLRRAYVSLQAPAPGDAAGALTALIAQLADRIAADLAASPDLDCRAAPAPSAPRPAGR